MSEEKEEAKALKKGVIIEYDFAVINGAEVLFELTKKFLNDLDNIEFSVRDEAKYLAGGNYQGAFAEYFPVVKTKKTAAKAAKDIAFMLNKALIAKINEGVSDDFKAFVKVLAENGVKVVISTRADIEKVAPTFADIVNDDVVLYHEEALTYGAVKWDAWRRACVANQLRHLMTIAIPGSGLGVKSALLAGMGAIAVMNDHVAYQDFSGADAIVDKLDANAAKKVLGALRVS